MLTFLAADDDPAVHDAIAAHAGRPTASRGCVVAGFDAVDAAVATALAIARGAQHVSVALHVGEAASAAVPRRCERLRAAANDGQVLLTAPTASLVREALPSGASIEDLGVHRLDDLGPAERVFALRADNARAGAAPLRSLDASPNNLPLQLSSFVGRRAEMAAVRGLLATERLVTLTGAGGSGKTRLAAHAAAEQASRWDGGVWWVELADAADSTQVVEQVAAATGALAGPLRSLAAQLADRRLLVCLDNCEHVLDAAAELAETLVGACPEVSILTTSREPLGVAGEVVWRVPTLEAGDAVALFAERARQVEPRFALGPANEAAVRALCARLDGMPLALELAAAWLRTLTPQQIEAGLDERFALLVRGRRGAPPRQQTLAASIDWSHEMLDEADRVVFRRLAVFAGGFDLEAARAVCGGDVVGALGRLVDKSMVIAEDDGGRRRLRLLETIRRYALERLEAAGEDGGARDRHLEHYLAVVEDSAPELDRDKDAWRERLVADYENLRAALRWGLGARDADRGRRLAAGLPWLWHLTGHGRDGLAFLQRAIERAPDDRSLLQARLLCGIALVADTAGPITFDAGGAASELAAEHGDERLQALCLALTAVRRLATDLDAAQETGFAAERAGQAAGDGFVVDSSRALHGIVLHLRDDHDGAQELLARAVDGLLARGDRGVAATALGFQALSALYTGELDVALELAHRAVWVAEPLADYHRVGSASSVLATVLGAGGDIDAAFAVMDPVLRLVEGAGGEVFVPGLARVLGTLHLWRGDAGRALDWLEPDDLLGPVGAALALAGRTEEATGALARAEDFARAHRMPRLIADALEQQALLTGAEDPDRAIDLHHEALALRVEHGLRTFYPDSLDALAALAAYVGREEQAGRVLAASNQARAELGTPRRAAVQALVADLRPAGGAALTLDDAVAYVRRTRGARARPPGGWHSLTPTELEVVRLAVEGLNNPEIGARLYMSRSTVKTHLSHVYAKLGVANRTELAKVAAPHLAS